MEEGCRNLIEKGMERDRGRPVLDRSNSNILPSSHREAAIHLHGRRVDHGTALARGSLCSTQLTTKTLGFLLSSFPVAQTKSILIGLSFGLGPSNLGYPLARHLLLRVGNGNIEQSEDFITMMHD